MFQTPPQQSTSWHRTRIAEISAQRWTRWLEPSNRPSPYLLPEWARLWEQLWPSSQAVVWQQGEGGEGSFGMSAVQRRRMGMNWVLALPFGTPGGWLGKPPANESEPELLKSLVRSMGQGGTVQVAVTTDVQAPNVVGWKRTTLETTTWILDLRDNCESDIQLTLSESHRRNIEKGARHQVVMTAIEDREAASRLFEVWPIPSAHRARIVLNPDIAPVLTSVFAQSRAMRWLTAWVGDSPVATTLWLVLHDRAVYVDGASVRDMQFTGVNHYLFHHVLTDLYKRGVRHFDLGSGPEGQSPSGLAQFKEGWGAGPTQRTEVIYRRPWYHLLRKFV